VFKRNLVSACVLVSTIALLLLAAPAPLAHAATATDVLTGPTIIPSVHNDVSVPLTAMSDNKKEKAARRRSSRIGRFRVKTEMA
jgi:hypothetical protein